MENESGWGPGRPAGRRGTMAQKVDFDSTIFFAAPA